MSSRKIREKFLEYYEKREHEIIPSFSLVPENDPTTLFTNSGMQPMLPYFLGEPYPSGTTRVADSQKCFRAIDIEEVGDNRHTTFFEMLGNWSFGDYWKEEQLKWIFEFLVDVVGLDPKKLYVSVFIGDEKNGIEKDTESADIWVDLFKKRGIDAKIVEIDTEEEGYKKGMQDGRIFYYAASKNWWSRSGVPENMPLGEPGGPDSEIFYDFGIEHNISYGEKCHPNCDCGRFIEIANSVFMEFVKKDEGVFEKLPKRNVDFGGGLERIAAAKNDDPDMFNIDLFKPVIDLLTEELDIDYKDYEKQLRVIADHLRGAVFIIAESVEPSNKGSGYILRRLIRRAAVKLFEINPNVKASEIFHKVGSIYVSSYKDLYFDESIEDRISKVLSKELKKFERSLEKGLKEIEKVNPEDIDAKFAFDLHQSYGFPFEITKEILSARDIHIDEGEFEKERQVHKNLSKTASGGAFKGGLGDNSEKTIWYHTLTHLLHKSLREVLGEHVQQSGSNITPERLRFDFTHSNAMTDDQIKEVEEMVNKQKNKGLEVSMESMPLDEALESGALAFFREKYADMVNVYTIGNFSKEICGGPHVKNTSEIKGEFKIVKENSSGSGIRRIKAVLK